MLKNRKLKFGIIAILSFFVSACFTILLFKSNSTTTLSITLMVLTALIFEMSKWALLREGFSGDYNAMLQTVFVGLWLGVTIGSITASCTYVLNETNSTENTAYISSTQYKQAEQARNLRIDTYNSIKTEIANIKAQASSLPKDYVTAKNRLLSKATEKTNELSSLSQEISRPIDVKGQLPSNGYTAFFDLIQEMTGYNSKKISLWFFMIIGILLELIANVFAYLYQKECGPRKSTSTPPGTKKAIPELEQKNNNEQPKKLQTAHAGNVLSFASKGEQESKQTKSTEVLSKSNVTNYINEMYRLYELNENRGYKRIASNLIKNGINITQTGAYKIRNHLEELGVIDGTNIIMSKEQALLAIRKKVS